MDVTGFAFDPRKNTLFRGGFSVNNSILVNELVLATSWQLLIKCLAVDSFENWKCRGNRSVATFHLI